MKDLMEKHGLTVPSLSREFDIPYRTVQNWYYGKTKCPDYTKKMIERILIYKKELEELKRQ